MRRNTNLTAPGRARPAWRCVLCLAGWTLLLPPAGWSAEADSAAYWNERLGTGINLGNALEAPREGAWGMRLEEHYFDRIADAGFDSVRIPVRWSSHADTKPPYALDPTFLARVDWAVDQSLGRGLATVLNMHHYQELYQDPDGHRERFLALWKQLAEHFRDRPSALLFEVLNEPHDRLNHEIWNPLLGEAVEVIRESNPHRVLVVGPDSWNAYTALPNLELPKDDTHLIVTFHYYLPFQFTHQGASWVGGNSRDWMGTLWEGTDSEKAEIAGHMAEATAWAKKRGVPLYLGEFGAYEKADFASRVAWTRYLRETARHHGISVAYWEFGSGFGVYDREAEAWRGDLLNALVPGAATPDP